MITKVKGLKLATYILQEKCPNCHKGQVFAKSKSLFQLPVMNEKCAQCNYTFDREPGYFIGAMYISYGLAVLVGILTFVICHNLFNAIPTAVEVLLVVLMIILTGKKNYKLSRIIYIHIFPW